VSVKRILLCERVDGVTRSTAAGVAVLVGVAEVELRARWDPATGPDGLPEDLKRRGAKRSRHARDAMGDNSVTGGLAYLAMRDWRCRIDFDEAAGRMSAVFDVLDDQATGGAGE
jgi:hypothetical protein